MTRPLCPLCNQRPVAINYRREGVVRYRSVCDACTRSGKKLKPVPPAWYKAGYRKKPICDKCGFRAKFPDKQMTVFYVDGNLKNNTSINLKCICLNCRVELSQSRTGWREAPLTPDF